MKNNKILHIINKTKKEMLLLYFNAIWCSPCKIMSNNINNIHEKYNKYIDIIKIDIDKYSKDIYKYNVNSVPTLIFIKNKEEIFRQVGIVSEDEISSLLEKYFVIKN